MNRIKDNELGFEEIITSYNVTALFACISPAERVNRLLTEIAFKETVLLQKEPHGVSTILSRGSNLFGNHLLFEQWSVLQIVTYDCSMGSPISPILANLVMEHFATKRLRKLLTHFMETLATLCR